jgi:HlyD family secretion protein
MEEGVYALEGKKVRFVGVKTGLMGSQEIEVASGLQAGQEVVVGPFRALRELKDGAEVVVQNEAGAKTKGE